MEQDGGETIREAFFLTFMKRLIVHSFLLLPGIVYITKIYFQIYKI